MHGGTNPGAPRGKANGNYRNGLHTLEMAALRGMVRDLRRAARDLTEA